MIYDPNIVGEVCNANRDKHEVKIDFTIGTKLGLSIMCC